MTYQPSSHANPRRITGQGLSEYIVIVALIAIAAVVAVGLFGSSIKTQFTALASELVGGTGSGGGLSDQANTADEAFDSAKTASTLRDYVEN